MISRCEIKTRPFYELYGGRGIKVCEEWRKDYLAFREWALKNGYVCERNKNNRNKVTLDRINNNGDYTPTNCRFVTIDEQNYNRSNTKRYEYKGKLYNTKELAEMANIPRKAMASRLSTMTTEKAVNTPYAPKGANPLQVPDGYISTHQIETKYKITEKQLNRVVLLGKIIREKYKNSWIYLETDIQQLSAFYANTYKYEWDKYSRLKIE